MGVLALIVACSGAAAVSVAAGSPAGRYYLGVGLLVAGLDGSAERVAAGLVADRPDARAAYYALLAAAQRRQSEVEAMMTTLDDAAAALPDSWDAHADRCWYGTIFDGAAGVIDSCERAVALAPDRRRQGLALARQSVALVRAGDLEAGRAALDEAFEAWASAGVDPDRLSQPWPAWKRELDAGRNPFDEPTLERERGRF